MTNNEENQLLEQLKQLTFKYQGPKFDAHVHLRSVEETEGLVKIAKKYNIKKSVGIMWENQQQAFTDNFSDRFVYAKFLSSEGLVTGDLKSVLQEIDIIHEENFPIVKFWYAPRWRDYVEKEWKKKVEDFRLDDPQFEPIFSRMEDYNLILLIHVSDPDLYYKQKYQPASYYGTKKEHLKEFEGVISSYPKLKILGAHMAGQPEHLDNLSQWLDKYPNLYVDTASAKWMTRAFSQQKEKAKQFFKKYSNRILFGTDMVSGRTDREPLPNYYYNRYLTFQALWETDVAELKMPIPDPENNNNTQIYGLDLPLQILNKLYWENGKQLFNF